jgi:hypothetical protein
MKLIAFSLLCSASGALERTLSKLGRSLLRPVQKVREWSWCKGRNETLRRFNTRRFPREMFD